MGRDRLKLELLRRGFEEPVAERALKNAYGRFPSRNWHAGRWKVARRGTRVPTMGEICGNAGLMTTPFSKSRKSTGRRG